MSQPFKRLLLATEHTEFDSGAERVAFEMARHCDLPLFSVLPVVSNPEYETVAPELARRAEKEAAARLAALRGAASAAGVQTEISVRRGEEPYLEIVQEAQERAADLIVVRRRGKRSFLSRLLVGEMVSKVASHAPCDVLFVPRAAHLWSQGLLASVDNSPNAENVVRTAAKVAKECALPLSIVTVISHDHENLRAAAHRNLGHMMGIASAAGVTAETRILTGKPYEQVLAAAQEKGYDLIVIGRHGESDLIRSPFGGTAQKVIGLSAGPVLVVRT